MDIFKYCTLSGLRSASVVCKAWNVIYNEDTLWKRLVEMRFISTHNIGLPKRKLVKPWRTVFRGCLRFFAGEEVDNCPWCASKYVDLLGVPDEPFIVCRVCYFSAIVSVCGACEAINTRQKLCSCGLQMCEACHCWECETCGWKCGTCAPCSPTRKRDSPPRYCIDCSKDDIEVVNNDVDDLCIEEEDTNQNYNCCDDEGDDNDNVDPYNFDYDSVSKFGSDDDGGV